MIKIKDKILSHKFLRFLQFFTNWFMQGVFHADLSERLYKLFFTIFFSFLFYIISSICLSFTFYFDIIFSVFLAHTFNFFLNCNIFVLLIHRIKCLKTNKAKLFSHLYFMRNQLDNLHDKSWILYCISLGGICQGTLNVHSDIDVCIIRRPGFINLIKSIIFYVKAKNIADFRAVPLDIFICDSSMNCLKRSKYQKNPIVLLDHNNIIDKYYPEKLKISIEIAEILNNK